jgi:hypothetical protein
MANKVLAKTVDKLKTKAVELTEKSQKTTRKIKTKPKNVSKTDKEKTKKKAVVKKVKPEIEDSKPEKEKQQKEKEARKKLNDILVASLDEYNAAYTIMSDKGNTLFWERLRAIDLILHIENLINSIANSPKEFAAEIAEIRNHRESFIGISEFAKEELEKAQKSALGASVGVATGTAVVSIAPSVAMWVATTFGTASTGTAISALSGAAAKSAALAWLGGGALTAGGGGIAAGKALIALSGPVGWTIAGVSLLSSIFLFSVNKIKLDKKKKEEIEAIKNNTALTKQVSTKIQELLDELMELRNRLNNQYYECLDNNGKDFNSISKDQQIKLGVLVNNTKSMAYSLSKNIE